MIEKTIKGMDIYIDRNENVKTKHRINKYIIVDISTTNI